MTATDAPDPGWGSGPAIARRMLHIPGIGSDAAGRLAERAADPALLRLEGMNTDLAPPAVALEATRRAVDDPEANRYFPFRGQRAFREAVARHLARTTTTPFDPETQILGTSGGLNGITDCMLALVNPGDEVVLTDPIYSGLVNRVHLVGGRPRHATSRPTERGWYTDPEELTSLIGPKTAVVVLLGTSMPTGSLLREDTLQALAASSERHPFWLIYDAAMEYVRFDGTAPLHPAEQPVLRDFTITVGSASKELRMIGWRVGWTAGPAEVISTIHTAGLTNVACQPGISQRAVAAALAHPDFDDDIARVVATWRERARVVHEQLAPYGCIPAQGGWSVLVDAAALGLTGSELSARLLDRGLIASTPMVGWGPSGDGYVRLTYGFEPIERLTDLAGRFDQALR
jgi:aspartate/methionine/tyrosine aminotransferase